ncbi:reverse transcriptase-like protein [Candidatus Micrarchaeota archaeon]|nr:reverse transcriptase-like protein [Candidatus Micrarchaeota archaeon]MBD3418060.1 reverse transcriptase-like protein [Candidatus Micrarchaeota archaeon]
MIVYTDGACSGNPGPMGIGAVVYKGGNILKEVSEPAGEGTNNTAEYLAVKRGLEEAIQLGADAIEIRTDSRLVVQQLSGKFRIKVPHLREIKKEIDQLSEGLAVNYAWVGREKNKLADKLAKDAIG